MADDQGYSKVASELVPDLTKALKLFKSRLAVIHRSIKQPFEDHHQLMREISLQESELIMKYQQADKAVMAMFHM